MVTEQIITKSDQKQTYVERIPKDWKIVQVGDHFNFKNGLNKAKKFFGQGTPIINYMNVYPYPEIYEKYIQGKVTLTNGELRTFDIRKGDVLFTRTSETLNEIGLSSVVLDDVKKTVFSGFLLRARPTTDLFGLEFKKYCFRSKNVRRQIISTSSKTTRALTNGKLLSKVSVLIPINQYEQLAISESISDIEKCIKQLDYLIEKKKNIKQGAIQEFLTGKKRLEGFSDEWEEVKFNSLCKSFTKQTGFDYSAHIKPKLVTTFNKYVIPFIQNKDFEAKKINFDTDYYIPEDVANDFPDILLDERCLLISISGSIGDVGIFSNLQKAFIGGAIGVAKFKNKDQLDWVMYYLLSNEGRRKLLKNIKSGAHHNLILADIREITIPIPSLNEQLSITTIFSDMDLEIKELEKNRDKYVMIKNGMMQKLLTGEIRVK